MKRKNSKKAREKIFYDKHKLGKNLFYDKKSDALWLLIKSGEEYEHKEVSPGVSVELGKNGELLGIEILNASKILVEKIKNKGKPETVSFQSTI